MGEFIEIGVNGASMQMVSGVFCAAAIGIYALMQPDASDDDDSCLLYTSDAADE